MAVSGYRFAGQFLAAAGGAFDVQHQNMGILELDLNFLVPGGKEVLILSLVDFKVPGRKMGVAQIHYLAGQANYHTKPEKQGDIEITFRDYPLLGTRGVLERWYQKTYHEETGFQLPSSLLKIQGHLVLFQTNATVERTARLEGLLLNGRPDTEIAYDKGDASLLKVSLACDRVVWEPSLFNPAAAA